MTVDNFNDNYCIFCIRQSVSKPSTPCRRMPLYPGRLTPGQMTPKFTRIYEQIPFHGPYDSYGSTNLGAFTPPASASPPKHTLGQGVSQNLNLNDPNSRNHNDIPMTPRSQEISNILNELLEMPNLPKPNPFDSST